MKNYTPTALSIVTVLLVIGTAVQSAFAATLLAPMPLISTGLPAYTSDDCFTSKPASDANSGNYSVPWRSCNNPPSGSSPVTLTYDISTIPSAERSNDVLVWFNDFSTGNYNSTLNSNNYYNTPKDYTVQGNIAGGGGVPPSSGWTTLATVISNPYHSLQHVLSLSSYNWVRLSFTSSDGLSPNSDISVSMDLHNASTGGITDDWIFFGDSITEGGLLNDDSNGQTFAQQINALEPDYYPLAESGGIGGFTSGDALTSFSTWLARFPGKFVALNYGTNDANVNDSPDTFYSNMATMAQDVISAGKIPIIPTIPWGCTANLTANLPIFNAKIQTLYNTYPEIVKGPDLYTYFDNNQAYIANNDCIHPDSSGGWTAYRAQWAQAMATAVYTAPVASINPLGGTVSGNQTVSLSSTKQGTLYYTIDGSAPTTSSTVYTTPFTVSSTSTIKTVALDQVGNESDTVTATYTFPATSSNNQNTITSSSSTITNTSKTKTAKSVASSTAANLSKVPQNSDTSNTSSDPVQTATAALTRTIVLTLKDTEGKPLANTSVTLESNGQTTTTNARGIAIFYNVSPGSYRLTVNNKRYTSMPTVNVISGTGNQMLTFKLTSHKTITPWYITGAVLGVTICVIVCTLVAYLRKRHNQALNKYA